MEGAVAAQRRGSELPKNQSHSLLFSASPRPAIVAVYFVSWGKEAAAENSGRHKKITLVIIM